MNLLLKRENSVLWLLESNPDAKTNLIEEAKRNGVEASRIIFSQSVPLRDHLSRQSCADLALDTFNFSGGTMTSLALKSGLPVLTMPGQNYASRMSSCDLSALGLHELIAADEDDYADKALRLSESRENTLKLRKKIIGLKETAAYFNSKQYCVDLESRFKEMISKS
tara:strand:- start:41 stop:541 length:501 start_codon:yes stop_codon:yes gene_type:complete